MNINLVIDKNGHVSAVDRSHYFTFHWKDDYYICITVYSTVRLHQFRTNGPYTYADVDDGKYDWIHNEQFKHERALFLDNDPSYSYVDDLFEFIKRCLISYTEADETAEPWDIGKVPDDVDEAEYLEVVRDLFVKIGISEMFPGD